MITLAQVTRVTNIKYKRKHLKQYLGMNWSCETDAESEKRSHAARCASRELTYWCVMHPKVL